ncbi:uncharacterized protein LOC8289473 [Ricinus communis]|uniref:Uncharacterized protein n=1 Tax=Ricinus communis TaxID=3988 RepID=B9SCA8_RICCO|nr:uncharacterized protein LOC8289473 [Ricinus communis]EEF38822.1 conserved hypothetical protein [Ricinus communis]|eukprot:XP_002523627.1 uncharacterized protein LOC8289473 [Ricinus communis]
MASLHLRSISWPSRSHPLTVTIEEQLHKLKTSQSSSIGHKLAALKDLSECIDEFLQLSLTQQTLSHEKQNQSVEATVNGSLGLLDMCQTTKEFFSQMRDCVQGLQLSLRKRKGGESGLIGIDSYMVSRKNLNKAIRKYQKHLKKQDKNRRITTLANKSSLGDVVVTLKDFEEISVAVFESILSFISKAKEQSKLSVVSKLLQPKHVSCEGEVEANEVEKVDAELQVLKSRKDINQMQNALKGLEALGLSLQEAEEELDCVYRRLVKIRVSLLNILNH